MVDSQITGLSTLLDAVNAKANLETLVVIFNVELEFDDVDNDELVDQLLEANLQQYKRLNYFEMSFYNNVQYPFIER
jgi:hypothetical protein